MSHKNHSNPSKQLLFLFEYYCQSQSELLIKLNEHVRTFEIKFQVKCEDSMNTNYEEYECLVGMH